MTDLKDYKIRVYHPTDPMTRREIVPESVIGDAAPYATSLSFSNARIGGCLDAKVTITARDPDLIGEGGGTWDNVLMPGAIVLIFIQSQSEGAPRQRWIGVVEQCGMGYGSNPHQRVLKCVGGWKYVRQYPMLTIIKDSTIRESVLAILAKCTHSHVSPWTGYVTYDPDPSYEIALMDCLDAWADQCFNDLGIMAGPDAIWGLVPRNLGSTLGDYFPTFYFAQVGDVAVDHGFEVGTDTVSEMKWTRDDRRLINGALVVGSAKLAGGDLILFVKPDVHANAIWRVARFDVPEAVDPTDMFRYGVKGVEARNETDERVTFKALNFASQPFANEIMNAPLSAIVVEGAETPLEVYVDKYTFTMDGDGSVRTDFNLGKQPELALWSAMPDVMRDIITAKSNLFVSAADMATLQRDVIRDWRRDAITQEGMINFWGVGFGDVASAVRPDEWQEIVDAGGFSGIDPSWPDVSWVKDAEKEVLKGAQNDGSGSVVSVFIPTGDEDHPVDRIMLFADSAGFEFWQANEEWWQHSTWISPNVSYWYDSDAFGRHIRLAGPATNAWKAAAWLNERYATGCPESPLTVWIGRPNKHYTATPIVTYGNMKTQDATSCTFIVFAADVTTTSLKGYCLAIYRAYNSNHAKFALGWYEGGNFHSNHWLAGPAPDSTPLGSIDLKTWDDDDSVRSLDLKVELPQEPGGTFRVRIRRHDSATDLWDSDDNHSPNTVDEKDFDLPDGNYIAATVWHRSARSQAFDEQPFGLKQVKVTKSPPLWMGASRNGGVWHGVAAGTATDLTGNAAWPDGKVGIRIAARMLSHRDVMRAWGVAFRTADEA